MHIIVEPLDLAAVRAVVALAEGPESLTWALHSVVSIDLLKMSVLVVLVLYVWLGPEGRLNGRAEGAVRGVLGLVLALGVDHAIQVSCAACGRASPCRTSAGRPSTWTGRTWSPTPSPRTMPCWPSPWPASSGAPPAGSGWWRWPGPRSGSASPASTSASTGRRTSSPAG